MQQDRTLFWQKTVVFLLTFSCYIGLHSIRTAWSYSKTQISQTTGVQNQFFGTCDAIYLLSYSVGLAVLSPLINKIPLNLFIGVGMILTCLAFSSLAFSYAFSQSLSKVLMAIGMGVNGFFQGVGWPGMMTAMANWFGKGKRGILLAIWSVNANVGNIVGLVGCSIIENTLHQPWSTNFFFASVLTSGIAVLIILFLKAKPESLEHGEDMLLAIVSQSQKSGVQDVEVKDQEKQPEPQIPPAPPQRQINFFTAFLVPRVPFYVISYSMIKACVNGLLFWLPTYLALKHLETQKAYISSMNDVGTFIGGTIVGYLGDKYAKRAMFLSPLLLVGTILMILVWKALGENGIPYYFVIFGIGFFTGGPYQIIGSAIAVDLGQHESLKGQEKAVSVISGLVEGCAAIMSAISLFVIPFISLDWLFVVFFVESLVATVLLTPLFWKDVKAFREERRRGMKDSVITVEDEEGK